MKGNWKRIVAALFSGCALALAGLGLAACADGDKGDSHSFGNWETSRAATCVRAGEEIRECEFCGTVETREIPPLGHSFFTEESEATCTADGFRTKRCTRCGESESEEILPALGHDYAETVVPPTCTERGYTLYRCERCGDYYRGDFVDAEGHDYAETVVPPTCTEPGYTAYLCTRCGDSYREETAGEEALGHDADEYGFCRRCHIVPDATKVLYSPSSESSLKAACYIKEIEEGSGEYRAIFASPERVCPDRADLSAFNVTELVFTGDVKEVQSDGISGLNDSPSVVRAVFGDGVETVCPSFWNYPNLSEISVGKGCKTLYVTGYVQGGRTLTIRYGGTSDEWAEKVKLLGSLSVSELYIGGEKPTELHLNCENVNDYAFYGLTQIQSVTFGGNVRKVGKYAFYNCTSLSQIAFGEGVREIGDYAFRYHAFAGEELIFPDSLERIGEYAFDSENSADYGVTLGTGLAFMGYQYRFSPTRVDYRGALADWCGIQFGYGILNGTKGEFYVGGEKVTELVIPDELEKIGDYAFSGGSFSGPVRFGKNVKEIGKGALNTSSHNDIEYGGTLKDWCSISFGADWRVMIDNVSLIIGGERIEKLLLEGTGAIPDYAFLGFDIGSVTLGDGVKRVGKYAFCYCKSLASLSLGDGVEEIGERAFNMCISLADLSLGTGLGSVGKYAFAGCENLSCTVRIPASLTGLDASAFINAPIAAFEADEGNPAYSARDGVLFDKEMKILVAYPRGKADETYTAPVGLNEVAQYAFYGNTFLKSVVFSAGLKVIGESAFENCTSLAEISFSLSSGSSNVTSVGRYAFKNTAYYNDEKNWVEGILILGSIILEAKKGISAGGNWAVKTIADYAFHGCSQMKYFILTKATVYIGKHAFGNTGSEFKLFYGGTKAQWSIVRKGEGIPSDVYFYSETEPTGEGNYWHYDDDGTWTPEIWGAV